MSGHEPLAIVFDERQQVGALVRREIDLAHAEKEDRVEVVQIADVELFPTRDARTRRKHDGALRNDLRIRANEGVIGARFMTATLDGRDRIRNRIVLIAVSNMRTYERVLT